MSVVFPIADKTITSLLLSDSSAIFFAAGFFAIALIFIQLSPFVSFVTEDKDKTKPLVVSKVSVGKFIRFFVFDFLTS